MIDISIVIRSKNEERFIGTVLEKIYEQKINSQFEVIVIDSGSTDGTLEIVRRYPVRLYEMDTRRFTFGYALNHGASLAEGRYVVFLSAHCIPEANNWLSNLISPLESTQVIATYGKQKPIRGLNPFEEFDMDKMHFQFSNANCAIKKKVLEKYPFDEKASFSEDYIWARTINKDYRIQYLEDASVFHSHPLYLKYWSKRFYQASLAQEYLWYVYGIESPWNVKNASGASGTPGTNKYGKTALNAGRKYLKRVYSHLCYFTKSKYYKIIPLIPFYLIFQDYYTVKGRRMGRRLYAKG